MLDYFSLFLVFFVFLVIFYGIIVVHDIPYEIAVKRNHPQQDAIHVAGWISLFTLGAIWPFLWIWATINREALRGEDIKDNKTKQMQEQINLLSEEIKTLKAQVNEGDK